MKTFGIGIIGTGAIAEKHAEAIQAVKGAELLAVCSSSESRANRAEEILKVKAYWDINDFLKHPGLDIVCICTASGRHLEPGILAAKSGKHLLVEKPIEVTLEKADQLINVCQDQGVQLGVIFQNRFSYDFEKLKAAATAGRFGKILMGNAYVNWYRNEEYYSRSEWKGTLDIDGGGALINQGIHTLDLLLDLMGEVDSVYGKVQTVLHPIEGEDLGAALVTFKNGAIGNVTSSTAFFPGLPERIELFGTAGSAILEAGKIVHWSIKGEEAFQSDAGTKSPSGAADPMAIGSELHQRQWQDFIQSIRGDYRPRVDGKTARKSLELIRGIYKSSKIKNTVSFPFEE